MKPYAVTRATHSGSDILKKVFGDLLGRRSVFQKSLRRGDRHHHRGMPETK